MTETSDVPDLNDTFWAEDYSSDLHAQTVLQRVRTELSQGHPVPITVAEVFEIAEHEMGYNQKVSHFAAGEVGRPLSVIAAVWGYKVYGMPNTKARSFGGFIGSKAGGDVILGPPADRWERAACELLKKHLGRSLSLGAEATNRLVNEVIALYSK